MRQAWNGQSFSFRTHSMAAYGTAHKSGAHGRHYQSPRNHFRHTKCNKKTEKIQLNRIRNCCAVADDIVPPSSSSSSSCVDIRCGRVKSHSIRRDISPTKIHFMFLCMKTLNLFCKQQKRRQRRSSEVRRRAKSSFERKRIRKKTFK